MLFTVMEYFGTGALSKEMFTRFVLRGDPGFSAIHGF